MFRNLHLYEIQPGWNRSRAEVADALVREAFAPCGATQPLSAGFVPPRGLDHSPLVEPRNRS